MDEELDSMILDEIRQRHSQLDILDKGKGKEKEKGNKNKEEEKDKESEKEQEEDKEQEKDKEATWWPFADNNANGKGQ